MAAQTVIISRSPDPGDERRRFEDELASALIALGFDVVVVPHLYHLSAGEEAVRRLAEGAGPVGVAAWLHPRAARWTLGFLGLGVEPRCVDMAAFATPGECARELADGATAGGPGSMDEVVHDARERWYPVLDYECCTQCGRCLDFCLFGVYARDDERVLVAEPDKCKPGCPACARVCPAGAIMFPHYDTDPAIAGAPGAQMVTEPIDVEAFYRLRLTGPQPGSPCPVCGCACDCPRSTDGTAPDGKSVCPACGCICDSPGACACDAPDDDLRELIDALADFDE